MSGLKYKSKHFPLDSYLHARSILLVATLCHSHFLGFGHHRSCCQYCYIADTPLDPKGSWTLIDVEIEGNHLEL